ncbi:MAG: (Fe-S)-binding protein [Planctomycetota bacterium]
MAGERLETLYDEVARCNRCGFCQSACPVLRVTGDESSVARGRIAFVRAVIEEKLPLTFASREVLYDCLLCKACVANCFPKVATPEIVLAARAQLWERFPARGLMRHLSKNFLTDQDRLARLTGLLRAGARTGVSGLLAALRLMHLFGGAPRTADDIARDLPERSLREELPSGRSGPQDSRRPPVNYFLGCAINLALPEVGKATIRLLERLGYRVRVLENACCGMPAYALGDLADARMLALENLGRLPPDDSPIVTDCSTCASFLKDYPRLFDAGTSEHARAEAFAGRVRDVIELIPPEAVTRQVSGLVTFHDPCHLSRYQTLSPRARAILRKACADYVELPEADWCCGGAGSYSVTHAALSARVLERKMENVRRTGAATVLTSCPACILQLRQGARLSELPLRVAHLTEFLVEQREP